MKSSGAVGLPVSVDSPYVVVRNCSEINAIRFPGPAMRAASASIASIDSGLHLPSNVSSLCRCLLTFAFLPDPDPVEGEGRVRGNEFVVVYHVAQLVGLSQHFVPGLITLMRKIRAAPVP